jgi:branched-chain amino acid transport system ATP-binding protein
MPVTVDAFGARENDLLTSSRPSTRSQRKRWVGAPGRTAGFRASERGRLLDGRGLRVEFGGVRAVDDVDFALRPGEIVGLIGPNGAGKTTLVNALCGFCRLSAGRVALDSLDVTGWPPHRLARAGLTRTFQSIRLFAGLTVLENVELGAVGTGLRRASARRLARHLLAQHGLLDRADSLATGLPHGLERRLGIVRVIAARPSFLFLDEPAAGLNEVESDELVETLKLVRSALNCALVVIEHDMRLIMRVCQRIHVLDHGKTISAGTPAEVRADSAVLTAYLGTGRVDAPNR